MKFGKKKKNGLSTDFLPEIPDASIDDVMDEPVETIPEVKEEPVPEPQVEEEFDLDEEEFDFDEDISNEANDAVLDDIFSDDFDLSEEGDEVVEEIENEEEITDEPDVQEDENEEVLDDIFSSENEEFTEDDLSETLDGDENEDTVENDEEYAAEDDSEEEIYDSEEENSESEEEIIPLVDTLKGKHMYIPIELISMPKSILDDREATKDDYGIETVVRLKDDKYEVVSGGYFPCKVINVNSDEEAEILAINSSMTLRALLDEEITSLCTKEYELRQKIGESEEKAVRSMAENYNMSDIEVQSILFFDNLLPELVDMIGNGITDDGAVFIAQMPIEHQRVFLDVLKDSKILAVTTNQARKLASQSKNGEFEEKDVRNALSKDTITLTTNELEDICKSVITKYIESLQG